MRYKGDIMEVNICFVWDVFLFCTNTIIVL